MVISVVAARQLPFGLFLFAYAVLGPLHYLTEIGWLHQRGYFARRARAAWVLAAFAFLSFVATLLPEAGGWPATAAWAARPDVQPLLAGLTFWAATFVFLALVAAVGMTVFERASRLAMLLALALGAALLLRDAPPYVLLFGIFLPTVVHVSLFTGTFILHGALRSRSVPGYLSLLVFVAAIAACLFVPFDEAAAAPSEQTLAMYLASNFVALNGSLYQLVHGADAMLTVNDDIGLRIQSFVAFSYTYHYLHWFSKTRIIRWHEVPRSWIAFSAVIWVVAVALFAWDYKTGLLALLFLSLLHIFLEFPLDYRTFVGIGGELGSRLRLDRALTGVRAR
jgi:hypothetical protein